MTVSAPTGNVHELPVRQSICTTPPNKLLHELPERQSIQFVVSTSHIQQRQPSSRVRPPSLLKTTGTAAGPAPGQRPLPFSIRAGRGTRQRRHPVRHDVPEVPRCGARGGEAAAAPSVAAMAVAALPRLSAIFAADFERAVAPPYRDGGTGRPPRTRHEPRIFFSVCRGMPEARGRSPAGGRGAGPRRLSPLRGTRPPFPL